MSTPSRKTTAPAGTSTVDPDAVPPCLALVIAWSASEPHRVGEIAFLPYGEPVTLGRGDADVHDFLHFAPQRPGEILAVDPREELLAGETISRRQLILKVIGGAIGMERQGRCRTYVNGVERDKAMLRPGDTVRLKRELLLLCVLRPKTLPRPASLRELHPFGEADAYGNVGESAEAWAMRAALDAIASCDEHVLVQGESGTGKELAARRVHAGSSRARGPFIACNASAIPSTLIEAELFGNIANYPNVGMTARKGLVGTADRGVFFLDEVGELSHEAQTRLLRVMDDGEYSNLGESTPRRADLRVLAATNRDNSRFRDDFLARYPLRVQLVPLRQRREDIPLLIRLLVTRALSKDARAAERLLVKAPNGRLYPRLSGRFVDTVIRQPLRTNVRQLQGIVLKAILASTGDTLRLPPDGALAGPLGEMPAGEASKEELQALVELHAGNKSLVAKALGISRRALYRKLEG